MSSCYADLLILNERDQVIIPASSHVYIVVWLSRSVLRQSTPSTIHIMCSAANNQSDLIDLVGLVAKPQSGQRQAEGVVLPVRSNQESQPD
jgi:hypothetical protein